MISAILNFKKNFYTILLTLDSIIYNAIDWFYDIFVALTQINVFADNSSSFNSLVRNVYVILGVIMLFVLAYSLLRAVIDPEQFSKKDNSFAKLIQNTVISLVIISFLPTIFQFAFSFQDAILKNHTIEKIILNDENIWDYEGENNPSPGRKLSYSMFSSFFHVDYEYCTKKNSKDDVTQLTEEEIIACESAIKTDSAAPVLLKPLKPLNALYTFIQGLQDKTSFTYFDNLVKAGSSGFGSYVNFAENAADGQLTYIWFFSTVAGIYVAYVLINFVFDVALRYIKLIFFEIIAPIPVFCRVIPGGKFKDVFSTWLKKTISVFLEVFIRVFVMIFGLYLIIMIADMDLFKSFTSLGPIQKSVANALILLGVVTFIKQAPKLICDLFHIDSGDMKLGIAEKLAAGGGLMAATAIGGAVGTGGRNLVGAVKNIKNAKSGEKLKAGLSGLASVGAGVLSGGARGFYSGRGAKNFKDVPKASGSAVTAASDAKAKREAYKASHKGADAVETMWNVARGHVSDIASNVSTYFGVNSVDDLIQDNKNIDNINSKKKALRNAAEELILGESNKQGVSKKFGLTGYASINGRNIAFDTAILRSMRQAKDVAIASGASNASVLQDEYDQYLKKFTDAVQNQALLGNTSFASMISAQGADARNVEADLGAVRTAAAELRRTLSDNLSAPYVADVGFNHEMLDSEHDLNLKDPAMDALGDTLKIAKNNNNAKINELNQKASSGDSN